MSVVRCITRIDPIRIEGVVLHGFRRGSTLLDCPTANLSADLLQDKIGNLKLGVYYGWAQLRGIVYKMVANIGKNPSFGNKYVTIEVHLLHKFDEDFYDESIRVLILGSIRTESRFSSLDDLKTAIHQDCGIATDLLDEDIYQNFKEDAYFVE